MVRNFVGVCPCWDRTSVLPTCVHISKMRSRTKRAHARLQFYRCACARFVLFPVLPMCTQVGNRPCPYQNAAGDEHHHAPVKTLLFEGHGPAVYF